MSEPAEPDAKQYRREFIASQYTLRAYRAHSLWDNLSELLREVRGGQLEWTDLSALGVSPRAMDRLAELGTSPSTTFAHPDLLLREPRLIAYYRCLALLPQKGLQYLAFNTAELERGRGHLTAPRAQGLARVLNGLISTLIESDPEWTMERAQSAALLNLGSQINGSWRNAIGDEGDRQIKTLLASFLSERGEVASATFAGGEQATLPISPDEAVAIRTIVLKNGYTVKFGSEPDVAIRDPGSVLVGTMEVKYGSDPAGALERYGAAKKSFDAAAAEKANVQNLFLANVVTGEVRKRIDADRQVTETFEFGRMALDTSERERFLDFVARRLLAL